MTWFIYALLGYSFFALVTVSNKFLLRQQAMTKPLVFTFWVGLFSLFTFILAPLGLAWPGWDWWVFDILTGVIYFFALRAFYEALDINEASRSASIIGGLTPIFTLILSYWFLSNTLNWQQFIAFLFLVGGGFLISLEKGRDGFKEKMKGFNFIAATVILHAVYFVALKYLFGQQDFITGFIWSRLGLVVAALAVLSYPAWRKEIFTSARQASAGVSSLMVGTKIVAGMGSLFVSLAVAKGNVSLVNALQGSEYVFLFLLTLLFSWRWPAILREKLSGGIIVQKIIAIIIIGVGLALIAV